MRFFPPPGAICNHGLLHSLSTYPFQRARKERERERDWISWFRWRARVTLRLNQKTDHSNTRKAHRQGSITQSEVPRINKFSSLGLFLTMNQGTIRSSWSHSFKITKGILKALRIRNCSFYSFFKKMYISVLFEKVLGLENLKTRSGSKKGSWTSTDHSKKSHVAVFEHSSQFFSRSALFLLLLSFRNSLGTLPLSHTRGVLSSVSIAPWGSREREGERERERDRAERDARRAHSWSNRSAFPPPLLA